jgi:hypothetical protein
VVFRGLPADKFAGANQELSDLAQLMHEEQGTNPCFALLAKARKAVSVAADGNLIDTSQNGKPKVS